MEENKTEGYVLKTFHDCTHDELLNGEFAELLNNYESRQYGLQLTEKQLTFIKEGIFPTVTWKGAECFAAQALVELIATLKVDEVVLADRETIKLFYQFLHEFRGVGIDYLDIAGKTLETVATVIGEINAVERDLRDASVELEAKKQGILPDVFRENLASDQAKQEQLQEIDANVPA